MKQYKIKIEGKQIPVTEEIYREYYKMGRRERYLEERDAAHGKILYSNMDTDELVGEEMIFDNNAELLENSVIQGIMFDQLRECLCLLTYNERELIDALFFSNDGDGMSEREYAKISGIPQQTINSRKAKIMKRLKNLLEN